MAEQYAQVITDDEEVDFGELQNIDAEGVTRLLKQARNIRTKQNELDYEAELRKFAIAYADPSTRVTPDVAAKPETVGKSVVPADILRSYYGDNLYREVAKASLANVRAGYPIDPAAPTYVQDLVKVFREEDEPRGASYAPVTRTVEMPNAEAAEIRALNDATYLKWLESDKPALKARAQEYLDMNNFDPAFLARSPEESAASSLEHEVGHHINRATVDFEERIDVSSIDNHLADADEITQAAGKLQRELYKNTGKRIEKPDDFMRLVKSKETPEYISPEAKRLLNFSRKLLGTKNEPLLEEISKVLPATVKNESEPRDFMSAVDARMGSA